MSGFVQQMAFFRFHLFKGMTGAQRGTYSVKQAMWVRLHYNM
jgi:hypothetical protein